MLLITIPLGSLFAQDPILDKKISIKFDNVELRDAIRQIEKSSGISFAYNSKIPGMTTRVTGSYSNVSLGELLNIVLGGNSLGYRRIGNQIAISQKKVNSEVQDQDNNSSIKGLVFDEATGEPLPGVDVVLKEGNFGTITDLYGRFTIPNLPAGTYNIMISALGYVSQSVNGLLLFEGETYDMGRLIFKEDAIRLNEVTVTPGSFSVMGTVPVSQQTLSEQNIKNMAWAEDITRAVARLPGISASDYSSKFAIRGGEADEVLISLDGMELYEPFHQRDYSGGLFSIVDVEAVGGIDLMTGGFSAINGNRLSGVFGMKTKNMANDESKISLGLSIMNARLYVDGKFANNRGSYLFSARRGMLDLSLKAIGNNEYFPEYYDGLAKIEYQLSDKHLLALHMLHSGDQAFIDNSPDSAEFDQYETRYFNTYAWLTLKSFYTGQLYSRTILSGGNQNHLRTGGFNKYDNSDKGSFSVNDQRGFNFLGLKQDWNYELSDNFHLNLGFDAKTLKANYNYVNNIDELRINANEEIYNFQRSFDIQLNPTGNQVGTYVNTRFKILPKLIAETGLRYDYTSYTDDRNWSPRASLAYGFSKQTFLRAGWGHYYQSQFLYNLDVNNGNSTFNPAELAKHYVLGFEHMFNNGISLRTEAYYKDLSNISPLWQNLRDHLENYPEARNDNTRVIFNGITSKGIELFLKYDKGQKISWWLSYALAQATDDIMDIEFDGLLTKKTGKVPRLNDQRHTIYADLNYRPNNRWHLSTSWQFYQGWPRTDYTYRYQPLPNGDLHFYQVHGEFNGTLYPAYHRLDVRVNKSFEMRKGELTAFLHLVNVYNRKNLKKFDLDTTNAVGENSLDVNGNYVRSEDSKNWLGFLPVFGVKWEIGKNSKWVAEKRPLFNFGN